MIGQPPAKRKATKHSNRQNKRNITIKYFMVMFDIFSCIKPDASSPLKKFFAGGWYKSKGNDIMNAPFFYGNRQIKGNDIMNATFILRK